MLTIKFLWILIFCLVFIWSAINPKDYFTWFLEVVPAIIAVIVLTITRKSFPLTPLIYILILTHCSILMVGGHYTYAEVPLFDDLKIWFDLERNNFDKLGHFAQGFVPAMIARELIIRKQIVIFPGWRNFFIACFALAFSALYELFEWWVAIATGEDAEAFLGTQGYVWDTQSDMLYALIGALVALIMLSAIHDKQLQRFQAS